MIHFMEAHINFQWNIVIYLLCQMAYMAYMVYHYKNAYHGTITDNNKWYVHSYKGLQQPQLSTIIYWI